MEYDRFRKAPDPLEKKPVLIKTQPFLNAFIQTANTGHHARKMYFTLCRHGKKHLNFFFGIDKGELNINFVDGKLAGDQLEDDDAHAAFFYH